MTNKEAIKKLYFLAVHEAGHALVALATGLQVHAVSIVGAPEVPGEKSEACGFTEHDAPSDPRVALVVACGGIVAQEIMGEITVAEEAAHGDRIDARKATAEILGREPTAEEVEQYWEWGKGQARKILEANAGGIEEIAKAVINARGKVKSVNAPQVKTFSFLKHSTN